MNFHVLLYLLLTLKSQEIHCSTSRNLHYYLLYSTSNFVIVNPFLSYDLYYAAISFIENISLKNNLSYSWFSVEGDHPYLNDNPEYERYKMTVTPGGFKYELKDQLEEERSLPTLWFHNNKTKTYLQDVIVEPYLWINVSWMVTDTLGHNPKLLVDTRLPRYADSEGIFGPFEINLKKCHVQKRNMNVHYGLLGAHNVTRKKSIKVVPGYTRKIILVYWTVDVMIRGYMSVWFTEEYEGANLHFYPISVLAGNEFKRKGAALVFTVKGKFKGVVVDYLEAVVSEYNLITNISSFDITTEPLSVTKMNLSTIW